MSDRFSRVAGIGGFGFLASVVMENALRVGQPLAGAPVEKIAEWYASQRPLITISEGFYASAIPCLLLFAVGMYRRLRDAAEGWALTGAIALVMMTPMFGLTMALDVVLNVNAPHLLMRSEITSTLWNLKSTMFTFNVLALATGLFSMGMACRAAGAGPRWLAVAASVAGLVGMASVPPVRAVVEGSPWGMLGLVPFLCWLTFLAVHSTLLVRGAGRGGLAPM